AGYERMKRQKSVEKMLGVETLRSHGGEAVAKQNVPTPTRPPFSPWNGSIEMDP
uniref:Uncharacterized protein n=1 Tax=Amphimedon queenslandica TaxID=400682 RepID=A0A1X7VDT5_AMPQE